MFDGGGHTRRALAGPNIRLEESLARGPNPRHLQRLFTISDASGMRFAYAAGAQFGAELQRRAAVAAR